MKKIVFGLVPAILLSACAAVDDKSAQAPREEKAYVTGSNLPQRDKSMTNVRTVGGEALEKALVTGGSAPAPAR